MGCLKLKIVDRGALYGVMFLGICSLILDIGTFISLSTPPSEKIVFQLLDDFNLWLKLSILSSLAKESVSEVYVSLLTWWTLGA